jgi:hypothetical protein
LTSWSRVLLEKLLVSQLVKKYIIFYGKRRPTTEFTSARHMSISSARPIQSTESQPTPLDPFRPLLLQLSSCFQVSPLKLYVFLFPPPPIRATCPAHIIPSFDLLKDISFDLQQAVKAHGSIQFYSFFNLGVRWGSVNATSRPL